MEVKDGGRPVSTQRFVITSEGGTFGRISDTGYELQIPQGSLPRGVDVSIQSHLSSPLEQRVPEGAEVMSGVYQVQSEDVKLERGGSIAIDHCVNISSQEDRDSIRLVRAKKGGPYEYVDNSQIEVRSSSVLVQLMELAWSCYAVVYTAVRRGSVGYCGILYRLKKEAHMTTSLIFRFVVVKKLNICIKAVETHYETCQNLFCVSSKLGRPCSHAKPERLMEPLPVHFAPVPDGEKRKLTLDLQKEGKTANGWKILPVTLPTEIRENDAYYYLPNNRCQPLCSFEACFEKKPGASLSQLNEFVDLKGTTSPESLRIWYDPDTPVPPSEISQPQEDVTVYWPEGEPPVSTQRFTITREGGTFGQRSDTGFELQVPHGSLLRSIVVSIQSHLAHTRRQEFPGNVVSGVYQVQSEEVKLERGGSITIDHCVNTISEMDRWYIRLVRAQRGGPYEYDLDHQVEVRGSSILVRLKELASSCYAVVFPARSSVDYCGILYRLKKEADMTISLRFDFIVVRDLNICIKAVENHYESCQNSFCVSSALGRPCSHPKPERLMEPLPVHFAPPVDSDSGWLSQPLLTLDLEEEGKTANGWKILPVTIPTEIHEHDAFCYRPNRRYLPLCSFEALSKKRADGSLPQLNEFVHLNGTTVSEGPTHWSRQCASLHIWYDPDAPVPSSETSQPRRDDTAPDLDQTPMIMKLVRFEGEMTRHYIPELIGGQYFLFSSLLLNDSTGAVVEAIERSCQQDSFWINREVLRRWLQGKGRKPVTWATLIGVLREDWNILAEDIEGVFKTTPSPGGQTTHPPDGVLTKAHLPQLMTMLSDSAYESFMLGIQLGLDDHLLHTLEYDAGHQSSRFLSSVLSKWLQRRDPPPTLDKLVAAISSPSINNKDLALRLQRHQFRLT